MKRAVEVSDYAMTEEQILAAIYWAEENVQWYTGIANGVVDTRLMTRDYRQTISGSIASCLIMYLFEDFANGVWS